MKGQLAVLRFDCLKAGLCMDLPVFVYSHKKTSLTFLSEGWPKIRSLQMGKSGGFGLNSKWHGILHCDSVTWLIFTIYQPSLHCKSLKTCFKKKKLVLKKIFLILRKLSCPFCKPNNLNKIFLLENFS